MPAVARFHQRRHLVACFEGCYCIGGNMPCFQQRYRVGVFPFLRLHFRLFVLGFYISIIYRCNLDRPSRHLIAAGTIGGAAGHYDPLVTVAFAIQNAAMRDGNEVAQLFLAFPAVYGESSKILRGFQESYGCRGRKCM
uniref:Uncharacterized protein n=1 Tax=Mycena chlorophos TaxID=658473 RepID=A0ABQ0M0Z6_MYCCL|nr:predicted protein [Mycena chlorophos]